MKYPLRTSRDFWKIPLINKHMFCDETCFYGFQMDEYSNITLVLENECKSIGKLEYTSIHLSNFDITLPQGIHGILEDMDTVYITDTEITIHFRFPLTDFATFKISNKDGFTLRQLIYTIQKMYEIIYRQEEETSTTRDFEVSKDCECANKDIPSWIVSIPHLNEICSICHSDEEEQKESCMLGCRHQFHRKCIEEWTKIKTTCPLCRRELNECGLCNNTRKIPFTIHGPYIPYEYRQQGEGRIHTDGMYGIYDHDYEDLYISGLYYAKHSKVLHVQMSNFC
jgi:hypothetical protein